MCDLRYMVPGKSRLALGYLMVICTVCSVQRTATFMTDYTMLTYHLKQVLLRVWNVLCPAVCTWYDPLGFRCSLPEQPKRSICGLRCSCILCIAPVLGGGCNFLDHWQKLELNVLDLIQDNVRQTAGTAQPVRGLKAEVHIHQRP